MLRYTQVFNQWQFPLHFFLVYCFGFIAVTDLRAEFPEDEFQPIEFRLNDRAVLLNIEAGARRVRIQIDEGKEMGWKTYSITHLDGRSGHLKLRLPDSVPINALRIEMSKRDPFPSSLYLGKKNFSETADQQVSSGNQGMVNDMLAAEDEERVPAEGGEVTVEESDIWKWRDRTLYFFNQQRGLQVFSLDDLDSPRRIAQLRMPAAGEQIYLTGEEHVVLLANKSNSYSIGGSSTGSEVVLIRHSNDELEVAQQFQLEGTFVESRMVGTRLYVVTRIWENVRHPDGVWRARSGMKIYAFDLADPSNPVALDPLDLTGDDSYYYNAVVTATPEYLFVVPSVYDPDTRRNSSWVHVISIADPRIKMDVVRRIPLGGHLNDKFKLAVRNDVLTTISQVWHNTDIGRHTLIETHDLRGKLIEPSSPLDSLVLAPGETVRATRFDDDRLYVVTFRQIDPLFAIDISRPRRLKVLGHIDIPGWSTYMELFGDMGRILSVGIEESRVAISLFDVADPKSMAMTQRVYLGDEGSYSWSEGNYDEKAVGFFPDKRLLVLPFSGRVEGSYRKQMQIIDVDDDKLTKRGVIDSEFNARRGKLVDKNKLVVISGQQLKVVDISKRDAPKVKSELTIAWSVDRVLALDNYLIQLEGGYSNWWDPEDGTPSKLRITNKNDPDTVVSESTINTKGQLIGASVQGEFIHLATSRTEATKITQNEEFQHWNYETFFTIYSINVSTPTEPVLTGSEELKIADESVHLGSMNARVLPGGELLWFPELSYNNYYPCWLCMDMAVDMEIGRPFFGPSGNANGWMFVTHIDETFNPQVLSATKLVDKYTKPGDRVETGPVLVSGNVARFGYHFSNWSDNKHNGRHFLKQVDFSNPKQPIQRKDISVPGLLKHIYTTDEGGTVLFTTRQKTELNKEGLSIWSQDLVLETSIFDGIDAYLVDSVEIDNAFYSDLLGYDRYVLISSNGGNQWWFPEGIKEDNNLGVFAWSDTDGSIKSLPDIKMESRFNNMSIIENKLFAFGYGAAKILALNDLPNDPRSKLFSVAGYFSSGTSAVEYSLQSETAWLATGSYGVETLNLNSLSWQSENGSPRIIPEMIDKEWLKVDIHPMQIVSTDSQDFIGSLPVGYGWRFQPTAIRESYLEWLNHHFKSIDENGFPIVPSAESDSDGDGVSNLMEFYLGTAPNDFVSVAHPSVNLIKTEDGNEYFVYNITPSPSVNGVKHFIEMSHDLIHWKDTEDVVHWQDYGPVKSARVRYSGDSPHSLYLRMKLEME